MRYLLLLLPLCVAAKPVTHQAAFPELRKWEGYSLVPYKDGVCMSVGLGHNLTAHAQPIRPYTDAECRAFYVHDFAIAQESCRAGVTDFDNLPQNVQIVTIGLVMCVGPKGFRAFKGLRLALSRRAFNAASAEIADSKWFHQVSRARAMATYNTFYRQP